MNKKILITGADGFIGSHLAEHMVHSGYKVRAFTLYNSFHSLGWLDHINQNVLREMEIFRGDIRDPHAVQEAVKECSSILHLAALIAIPFSYYAPQSYVETNILGTLNILQAARDQCLERVVVTSTSEVYGTAQFVPITEQHPLHPQSPYAATKVGADQLALSFYRSFDLPITVLRPFNTYGPRQSARAVIPTVITQIATKQKNIKLGKLTPTRDFSFVSDTCHAFEAVLRSSKTIGQVLNAGSGFEISIKDTVKLITEIMSCDVTIDCDEQRLRPEKSEVDRLYADASRLKILADWSPEYGGLDGFRRGLEKTIEWFLEPKNTQDYKIKEYAL